MSHGILGICSAAHRTNLNLAFAAMGMGPDVMTRRITDDPAPTTSSEPTHFGMYDASAKVEDGVTYASAKDGFLPNTDVNGQPIYWGENGIISEPDAVAAFQSFEFWINDSTMATPDFAAAIMAQAGLIYVPDEI